MSGNNLQLKNGNLVVKNNKLVVAGAGDPCCCIGRCGTLFSSAPSSIQITLSGVNMCDCESCYKRDYGDCNGVYIVPWDHYSINAECMYFGYGYPNISVTWGFGCSSGCDSMTGIIETSTRIGIYCSFYASGGVLKFSITVTTTLPTPSLFSTCHSIQPGGSFDEVNGLSFDNVNTACGRGYSYIHPCRADNSILRFGYGGTALVEW